MPAAKEIVFPPFRLDTVNECLWRGERAIALTPKAFAVLRCLVAQPGRLVTKEELLNTVWPQTVVSDAVLKVCVREVRKALGDNPQAPQFIETVHRRGYRFIASLTTAHQPVAGSQHPVGSRQKVGGVSQQLTVDNWQLATRLVGREAELQQLQSWLEKALQGERQVVFVTGEAGIGKTTLVNAFLEHVVSPDLWIARGQCVEHYGTGEAYLPVLEALGRLCRAPQGERLVALLHQQAPTWLAQLPWLLNTADRDTLQRELRGTTRERMLREMAEALEALTWGGTVQEPPFPLILWLEDLQWSDYSTLDLVSFLARRQEPARLLVIGTYRPVDVIMSGHPLKSVKQELQVHGQCTELSPTFLSESEVAAYLEVRFPHSQLPPGLARMIHQRTDGNPLFMVNLVDYLVAQGLLKEQKGQWELQVSPEAVEVGVPENLRQMIEQQSERLSSEEQRVLKAASVAGVEFSTAAVTAALEEAVKGVEGGCEGLARRGQFLRPGEMEEWPDATVTTRYRFTHTLYQQVLYDRVPLAQRLRFHQQIGERKEGAYGDRAGEIAAELAVHFEQGRDYGRAVKYLQQAARTATRRSANREAISHLTRGLELLKLLPDTPERTQQELVLQLALGGPLMATKGYANPEVEHAYARARELCQQVGDSPQLFTALLGLWGFYLVRGELHTARELGEQGLRLAQLANHPTALLAAHLGLGTILYYLGELTSARAHLEQGRALYDPQKHRPERAPAFVQDPRVNCLTYGALVLWSLGYPDQALQSSQAAVALAQELAHPFSLAYTLNYAAGLHWFRREEQATRERAEAAVTLSTEQGFPQWRAMGMMLRGWVLGAQGRGKEGIAHMQQGLSVFRATGAGLGLSFFLALLADIYGKMGQAEEGLRVLAEALAAVQKNEERFCEAELYRLKGELTLQSKTSLGQVSDKSQASQDRSEDTNPQSLTPNPQAEAEAEAYFLKAIEIARKQQAKSLELRAGMSLARLWQQRGRKAEARQMLAEIYSWFTEGFETRDLQDAAALLRALEGCNGEGQRAPKGSRSGTAGKAIRRRE